MTTIGPNPLRFVGLATIALLAVLFDVPPLHAQIPETFTNLQVLPKDTPRGVLIGRMRNLTGALGVRCGHCHVGEDPERLVGMDFASDDKELKRVARAMMTMTEKINADLLPAIGRDETYRVRCRTCHHGLQKPGTLKEELLAAHADGGVAALSSRYAELRETYYGEGVYDFGEFTLPGLAETLFRSQDVAGAAALLELNLEHFPESGYTYTLLGLGKMQSGDAKGAEAALEKALEIDPENGRAKQGLERIRAQEAKED